MKIKAKFLNSAGPIILSAFSIFASVLILQPFALFLDPTFNLFASRGIGKVAFVSLVLLQIVLLISIQSNNFLKQFFKTNLLFFKNKNWIKDFFKYFSLFFIFHAFVLFILFFLGYIKYNSNWGLFNIDLILKTLFGFFVVFMLAWTEELIFRGTLYPYFRQKLSPITSLLTTSLIFMLVHDLKNPLNLVTKNWNLGLGLFLLGITLNLIFIGTKKLYTGMGAHAGLVFVKVILRRAPFLVFLPANILPFWINKDLRMSSLSHILFFVAIVILVFLYKKNLFIKKN